MGKILKNVTASTIVLDRIGMEIPASSQYIIEEVEYLFWSNTDAVTELTPLINAGDLVLNDGIRDLPAAEALDFILYPDFAPNQRFLSEPERSNSMNSKTTQKAIEEARVDVEKDGVSIQVDTDIINFEGDNVTVTTDAPNRKVTVSISDDTSDTLYWASCATSNDCVVTFDLVPLVDHTLCLIREEDC